MAKFLEQQLVTEYAQLCAEIDKMDAARKKLREEIIAGFSAGLKCPHKGPYLVKMTVQQRRNVSWKDEWVDLAKAHFGKLWKKAQKKILAEALVTPTPTLLTDVNPDYEVEAPSRPVILRKGA